MVAVCSSKLAVAVTWDLVSDGTYAGGSPLKFRETCSILYKDDLSTVIYVPKLLSLVIEINCLKAQKTIIEIVIKI